MTDNISKDLYAQRNDTIRSKLFFYEGEVNKNNVKLSSITIEKIKNAISNMDFNQSDIQSLEYKKKLLSTFVDRIVATNDGFKIEYRLPFHQSGKDLVPNGAGDRT